MPIAVPQSPVECHGDTLKKEKIDFGETEPAQSEKQKKQSALCYINIIALCDPPLSPSQKPKNHQSTGNPNTKNRIYPPKEKGRTHE